MEKQRELISLKDAPVGSFFEMDVLQIYVHSDNDFILAMAGEKCKRGGYTVDITVFPSTQEKFLDALRQCDKSDSWSHILIDTFDRYLTEKTEKEQAAMETDSNLEQ